MGKPQNGQRQKTILVVEDNLTSKLLAKSILLKFGYHVETASDGLEAIQLLNRMSFDLILMDCQMPNMDGFQATRIIRSTESIRIPIIALTAAEDASIRDKYLAVGMDDFLAKPVSARTLTETVARWLQNCEKPEVAQQQENKATAIPDPSPMTISQAEKDSLFNLEIFLTRVMGDKSIADSVMQSYLEEMPVLMEHLRSAIDCSDNSAIEGYAHSIKSLSGYVTAGFLQEISRKIELNGQNSDKETLSRLMGEIDEQFRLFKQHIIGKRTFFQQTNSDTH